jgi:GTP-binding protein
VIAGVAVVALVGRPNVGKSALFNRIVGSRRAIVDDVPGVTRDRLVASAEHAGHRFLCVDTGGFHADLARGEAGLSARVRQAALQAVEDADVLVCVVDGQAGLLPDDEPLVRLLERTGKPLVLAVNKLDIPSHDAQRFEFHRTGAAAVVSTSAAHNRGIAALLDAVVARLPAAPAPPPDAQGTTRVALIGRPNVGKSSLVNRLCGSERVLVSPEPGTTRDTIDTTVHIGEQSYVLVDTAGIRRVGRVTDPIERHGAVRALAALERTDLVLLVLDATDGITDQDARLTGRALEAGRGVILVANKWDLLAGGARSLPAFREAIFTAHPGLGTLPVVPVSAATGEGVERLVAMLRRVERCFDRVLQTATLNRALQAAVTEHAPAAIRGRPVRILYATQTGRRPPEVTAFTSDPTSVSTAYRRYLINRLTETFAITGVPLRLVCRRRHPPRPLSESRGRDGGERGRRSGRPTSGVRRPRRR